MRQPLVYLALAFCIGIAIASFLRISFMLVYVLAGVFLLLSYGLIKKDLVFYITLFVLTFFLGATFLKNSQKLPTCHIARLLHYNYKPRKLYLIKGTIDNQPEVKDQKISFIFRTNQIQVDNTCYRCCGKIKVFVKNKRDLYYGEELILGGELYRIFSRNKPRTNMVRAKPSPKIYRNYLCNQGIFFIMKVKKDFFVVRLNRHKGLPIKRFAFCLKDKLEDIIFRHTSAVTASILDAMIIGEKKNILPSIYNSMIKSGTVHILVVSGFNVGVITFIIVLFLKLLRLPRKVRFLTTILCLIIYCLLTGASNPVVRATIMAIVFILAYFVQREANIYNSLVIALLSILMFNPQQLFDVGFQLSFTSVFSLIYLYPKIRALLRTGKIKIKPLRFLFEGCLVSFSAWLGTMGFIAYYFKIFSPITVLANIFIVPLATLITLCGFSMIIIDLICPGLVPLFASTNELVVGLLLLINHLLLKIPGAYLSL